MLFRSLLDSLKPRSARAVARPARRDDAHRRSEACRLKVESLEDRTVLSAVTFDAPPASLGVAVAAPEEAGHAVAAVAAENQGARVLWGQSGVIDGARVVAWALVSPHDGTVLAAGVTFSLKLAETMPQPGDGPDGAIAALAFPAVVQNTTFFNHLEIHSNPDGHEAPPGSVNPDRNRVPHFDFHFYGIPEEQVWAIPDQRPPLPVVPADRLPAGYTQPGRSVLQMGRHSGPIWALSDPNPLSTIVLVGYLPDGSQMHFLEPMISQEVLLARQDFTLPVPTPRDLGRASPTLYPTSFNALFQGDTYSFVYSGFVTQPAGASGVRDAAAPAVLANLDRVTPNVPATTGPSDVARLLVAGPEDGTVPSGVAFDIAPAFRGLDVAAARFIPQDPIRPLAVAPVFALNYGTGSVTLPTLRGLDNAFARLIPGSPVRESPVFIGLADALIDGGDMGWTWEL